MKVPGWRLLAIAKSIDVTTRRYLDRGFMDLGAYLSGYADGEGCFCVTFNRSKRHTLGWDIRPSFSVSQNHDRAQVLEFVSQDVRMRNYPPRSFR